MVSVNHLSIYHYLSICVAIICIIIYVSINLPSMFLSYLSSTSLLFVSLICHLPVLCIIYVSTDLSIMYLSPMYLSSTFVSIIYVSINLPSMFLPSIYHPPIICVSHLSSACVTYHLCIYKSISYVSITYVSSIFLSSVYQSVYKLWIICLCISLSSMYVSINDPSIHPSIHPWGGLSDTQNHNSGSHKKNVFNNEIIDFSICAAKVSTMIE